MQRSLLVAAILAIAICGEAFADELADEPVSLPGNEAAEPAPPPEPVAEPPQTAEEAMPPAAYVPYDGEAAVDAWNDARGCRYGTHMLFPFTRGMEDAGITGWARWPTAVLTVPLDVALLPTGMLAGLFGG